MSVQQYLRKASLLIGDATGNGIDLSALRFAFSIRRGDMQTPNSAEIRVYNVSDATASNIMQRLPAPEFTRVVIQAGYEGNFGVIFDGSIKQVRHGRESQTDTYLDLSAADGDSAYNFSVTALSLAAGATPQDKIQMVIRDMARHNVSQGYMPANLQGNPTPRGEVLFGMSRDQLRTIARDSAAGWSIQDGKVDFIPLTEYKPGEVPVITSATGMIGLPEQTQNGIKLITLLNPSIKIGQAVKLDNASIQRVRVGLGSDQTQSLERQTLGQFGTTINSDGLYYVMRADHNGDTRGNDWYTHLICLAINADVPLSSAGSNVTTIGQPYVDSIKPFG